MNKIVKVFLDPQKILVLILNKTSVSDIKMPWRHKIGWTNFLKNSWCFYLRPWSQFWFYSLIICWSKSEKNTVNKLTRNQVWMPLHFPFSEIFIDFSVSITTVTKEIFIVRKVFILKDSALYRLKALDSFLCKIS